VPSSPMKVLQVPLTLSPIKILTPTKMSVEPLHLSPWCNPRASLPRRVATQYQTPETQGDGSQKSTLNPTATEFVPKTYKPKPTHNPLGGKLALVAAGFFERAYGLNGQKRVDHKDLKEEMMNLTGCSERAVQAVLYGSSYSNLLDGLRAQIPGYTVQKDMQQDFSLLPFYNFDGNAQKIAVPPAQAPLVTVTEKVAIPNAAVAVAPNTNYSTVALLALAAILPFTLLC